MIRFGLCCIFRAEPIHFRRTTAAALARLPPRSQRRKLADLCRANAEALYRALEFCAAHGIGAFRVNSQILPLKTHPAHGYSLDDLPDGGAIRERFLDCGRFRKKAGMRLSFHPDQFVLLNSPRPEVVAASIKELAYQAEVAGWIGADVVNIHGGGAYGEKISALRNLAQAIRNLAPAIRRRLTLENDDRTYPPAALLPICHATGVPLVYDVHHHRCLPDGLSVEAATKAALATWDREPLFHLSSPLAGWRGRAPYRHHDYIDPADFPDCWRGLELTVEVEAKAKELAVLRLKRDLARPCPARRRD